MWSSPEGRRDRTTLHEIAQSKGQSVHNIMNTHQFFDTISAARSPRVDPSSSARFAVIALACAVWLRSVAAIPRFGRISASLRHFSFRDVREYAPERKAPCSLICIPNRGPRGISVVNFVWRPCLDGVLWFGCARAGTGYGASRDWLQCGQAVVAAWTASCS